MKHKDIKRKKNSDFPVEFPPKNDGPIFHLLLSNSDVKAIKRDGDDGDGDGNQNLCENPMISVNEIKYSVGLNFVEGLIAKLDECIIDDRMYHDHDTKSLCYTDTDSIEKVSMTLLVQLCTNHQKKKNKPTLRQQLAYLRTYKNEIMKIIEASTTINAEKSQTEPIKSPEGKSDNSSIIIGVYRILCELCLSTDTPHSFKKAGYSCLTALTSLAEIVLLDDVHALETLNISIIESILCPTKDRQFWKQPIQTLFDAFTFEPMKKMILENPRYIDLVFRLSLNEGSKRIQILKSTRSLVSGLDDTMPNNHVDEVDVKSKQLTMNGVVGLDVLEAIERSSEICTTLKVILTSFIQSNQYFDNYISSTKGETLVLYDSIIKLVIKPLMYCPATSTDALIVGGVCYSQILLLKWTLEAKKDDQSLRKMSYDFLLIMIGSTVENDRDYKENLPDLMVVKGLTSTLSNHTLALPIHNPEANDQETTLMEQIAYYMMTLSQNSSNDAIRLWALKGLDTIMGRCKGIIVSSTSLPEFTVFSRQAVILTKEILQIALVTFDSPPCKQIGSAIPGLFKGLINLLEVLDGETNMSDGKEMNSMDVLVTQILMQPSNRKGKYVALDALLFKVGPMKLIELSKSIGSDDIVSSFINEISERGNSAGAVSELLGKILSMLREEMHKNAGVNLQRVGETKKERRKREKLIIENEANTEDLLPNDDVRLIASWFQVWVPSFAKAMTQSQSSKQRHIASYCLPLIVTMVGGTARKIDACHSFAALLDEISSTNDKSSKTLWAKLEVIRHASLSKLFRSSLSSSVLRKSVSNAITSTCLRDALVHEASRVRVVAFQTISIIVPTLQSDCKGSSVESISLQTNLWRRSFAYAFNCSEREHMLSLNDALYHFLSHLADSESSGNHTTIDSALVEFVGFLLGELFLTQSYPGTISQKESFSIGMLDILIKFASQVKLDKKTTQKNTFVTSKTRHRILSSLVSDDVFATLFSLLFSIWDATRTSAFATICRLVDLVKYEALSFPLFLTAKKSRKLLMLRAFHLASSPRQREADTGARLLAILFSTLPSQEDQPKFLQSISMLLEERLKQMEAALGVVLNPDVLNTNGDDARLAPTFQLPLAHGLIQALQFIVNDVINVADLPNHQSQFVELTKLFSRAIEVSLVVVADLSDNTEDSGSGTSSDERWKAARSNKSGSTPLNVNTGALGANATFASTKPIDEVDSTRRIFMQRILIGSWLLTREACAGLSSIITLFPGTIDFNLISTAGDLLISTLTTLKHQGAAFAAHKALQSLSARCFKEIEGNQLRLLPNTWSHRVLNEISCNEIVRDSTLRRSTGYGLGILSIMRTEPPSGPKFLFQNVLSSIIRFSLPSYPLMEENMRKWNFTSPRNMFLYPRFLPSGKGDFVPDEEYENRTRIHALNILRLVILDAPLALEMRKFVGDSLISALIGCRDTSWGIRNSATMTFTAAMLRVVDADKNGEAKMRGTKNVSGINAISASELFRSYPSLGPILLAMIKEECQDSTSKESIHPVLFPLLLMMSRLQPIYLSQIDPSTEEISMRFIQPVLSCLGHVHHKVRVVASRALNVLCSGDEDTRKDSVSRRILITKCIELLSINSPKTSCHNKDHGVLMALKCLLDSRNCRNPHIYFDESLKKVLSHYASWGEFRTTCPPSCVAIALDIWHCIYKSVQSNLELSEIYLASRGISLSILDVVINLVRYIEDITVQKRSTIIGLATLASTAGKVAIEIIFPHILSAQTLDQCVHYLRIVQDLMCSEIFDVMLHSVKSFKKKIWTLVESNNDAISKNLSPTLNLVYQTFTQSLLTIYRRDGSLVHPPTIRRITRCILETAAKYRSLSSDHKIEFGECSLHTLYDLFSALLVLDTQSDNHGTYVGNALELMALTIPELWDSKDNSHSFHRFKSDINLFVDQVFKLSDAQTENWKLRLSAASSIKESKILVCNLNPSSPLRKIVNKHEISLYFRTVQLLQDNDEDVRRVAASALLGCDEQTASLCRLEQGYRFLVKTYSNESSLFTLLTNQIITEMRDLVPTISEIIEEYNCSLRSDELSEVQNLSSKRKIFEEEDISAFEESLLVMHLSIQKLAEISSNSEDQFMEDLDSYQSMVETCRSILKQIEPILKGIGNTPEITHNILLSSKAFGKIHGILLVAIFSIYHYGIGMDLVQQSKFLDASLQYIHPCIAETINTLKCAKQNEKVTYERLKKCCFLATNFQWLGVDKNEI